MPRYMIVTCLFLFWAFYEMSGGADFQPPERPIEVAEAEVTETPNPLIGLAPVPEPEAEILMASAEAEPALIDAAIAAGEAKAAEAPQVAARPRLEIYLVDGNWVNLRDGPSTAYDVLDTLPRGTAAEVMEVNDDGWARIRLLENGRIGWMAERLLSAE